MANRQTTIEMIWKIVGKIALFFAFFWDKVAISRLEHLLPAVCWRQYFLYNIYVNLDSFFGRLRFSIDGFIFSLIIFTFSLILWPLQSLRFIVFRNQRIFLTLDMSEVSLVTHPIWHVTYQSDIWHINFRCHSKSIDSYTVASQNSMKLVPIDSAWSTLGISRNLNEDQTTFCCTFRRYTELWLYRNFQKISGGYFSTHTQ
jgi:hypothetical protein